MIGLAAITSPAASPVMPPPRPAELGAPEKPRHERIDPSQPEPQRSQPAQELGAAPREPGAAGCIDALMAVQGNRIRPAPPEQLPRDQACRIKEAVVVEALAVRSSSGTVALVPPPTLSCAMAKAVSGWLDIAVQPLARGQFEKDLLALQVGGGQECRRRNRASAGPFSEHATGEALDIFAFRLEPGAGSSEIRVAKPDGLPQERFLAATRQSACGAFMTALGPGSDAAHADHLHVDIQERRSPASRFCQ